MEIFCGAVTEPETRLCAWSYIIRFNKKEYKLVSNRVLQSPSCSGELIAAVKSFGYVRNLNANRVGVYFGDQSLIEVCSGLANSKTYKKTLSTVNKDDKGLYCCLAPYLSRYNVTFHKISNEENPAYELAVQEFQKVTKPPEEDSEQNCDENSSPPNE